MVLSACSNGNKPNVNRNQSGSLPNNKIDVVYDENVKSLTIEEATDIQKATYQDDKLDIQVSEGHVLATKKSGDVVFIPAIKKGYFDTIVVVTSVNKNNDGTVTVTTRRPTPNEAFDKVNLDIDTRKTKAEIQGIILPTGQVVDIHNLDKSKGIQSGLVDISLPDVQIISSNEEEGKFQLKISQAIVESKNKYVTDQECREKAISFLNTKKSGRKSKMELDQLEKWKEKNCNNVLTMSGTIDLKAPQLVTNIDMQKLNTADFVFNARNLNKMSFDNLHLSGDIIGEIRKKEYNFFEKMDHSNLYKEFEKRQIGSSDGLYYASLSGLSADDKKGKIPLFGIVLGVASKPTFGHEANTIIRANQMAGLVVQVYGVAKATIDGKVEWKVELQPMAMDVGLELKNNEWKMISHIKSVNTNQNGIDLAGGVQTEATVDTALGLAVDADFLLGGVRLANAGAEMRALGINAKAAGNVMVHTRKPHLRVEGCLSNATINGGLKVYSALDIKGNFRVGKGWLKAEGGVGALFKYVHPTDETKSDSFWFAKSIKDVCFSSVPPQIKIESVEYDENSSRVTEGFMPLDIKVKNNSKGSVDKWYFILRDIKTNQIIYEYLGIINEEGNLTDRMGEKFEIPEGNYVLQVKAIDFKDREGISSATPVSFTPIKKLIEVKNIIISPSQLSINQPFELTITGQNLPMNNMLTVNGCSSQTKISLTASKHIYKCIAPATATDNYTLSVIGTDGTTSIFNKKVKVITTTLPPIISTATKLPATGITLCADNNRNNIICSLLPADWLGLKQDGEVQAGQKMSYTTLYQNGAECVRDNVTGLIWEQKTNDGGLRDKDNTYTWYNPNNRTNGGHAGYEYAGKNTHEYIRQLNAQNYCGYHNWRLPTSAELDSIVDYSRYNPAINPIFTNTQSHFYWSASPHAYDSSYVWGVDFDNGGDDYYYNDYFNGENYSHYVRAVRSN